MTPRSSISISATAWPIRSPTSCRRAAFRLSLSPAMTPTPSTNASARCRSCRSRLSGKCWSGCFCRARARPRPPAAGARARPSRNGRNWPALARAPSAPDLPSPEQVRLLGCGGPRQWPLALGRCGRMRLAAAVWRDDGALARHRRAWAQSARASRWRRPEFATSSCYPNLRTIGGWLSAASRRGWPSGSPGRRIDATRGGGF